MYNGITAPKAQKMGRTMAKIGEIAQKDQCFKHKNQNPQFIHEKLTNSH
jgi:hypothetical protein